VPFAKIQPQRLHAREESWPEYIEIIETVARGPNALKCTISKAVDIALREETGRELFDLAKQATAAFPGLFDIVGGDRLISVGDMTSLQFKPTYNITTGPCELVITKLQ
jgi:hypothetical protein